MEQAGSPHRGSSSAIVLLDRYYRWWLGALLAGAAILAWLNRLVLDDAFISFRYARNLVSGHGLVWNPGERVEGYTNFLWTLLMAVPEGLGLDTVQTTYGLGILLVVLTLWLTSRVAVAVSGSKPFALLTVALLGTNYTFSAYATGGLETQLLACLVTAILVISLRVRRGFEFPMGCGRFIAAPPPQLRVRRLPALR